MPIPDILYRDSGKNPVRFSSVADANGINERIATHEKVSKQLEKLDDHKLKELLETAHPIGTGIGGPVSVLDIEGTKVFVKNLRLTDTERSPENWESTANLFGLPLYYQYGVGSAGFGS